MLTEKYVELLFVLRCTVQLLFALLRADFICCLKDDSRALFMLIELM